MAEETGSEDAMWAIGVFDAHCHPTDIRTSINDIFEMKARVLTVMSTRAQDQELVVDAARQYTVKTRHDLLDSSSSTNTKRVVPAFGWHPWFSYQMVDDQDGGDMPSATEHYKNVLTPVPEDESFLTELPKPRSLSQFLAQTEKRLEEFPLALIGEIGLDRPFRLPVGPFRSPPAPSDVNSDVQVHTAGSKEEYTPGSREGRALSPYRVHINHQRAVLLAQLRLAAQHRRPVSVHSVQAHGVVFELLQSMWKGHEKPSKSQQKRQRSAAKANEREQLHPDDIRDADAEGKTSKPLPYPPRICMHSYSGPPDALVQFLHPSIPAEIYFSFSEVINFSSDSCAKVASVIEKMPDDRILVESDLHCAGDMMDDLLRKVVRRVCQIKGWSIEDGAKQLKSNWERFIFGN